jgi:fatty acid-binding protein DegV
MIGTLFDKIANPDQKYQFLEELGRQGVTPKKQVNLTPIKNSAFSNKAKHKIYIDNNDPESSHPIQWNIRRADEASQNAKRTVILAPLAAMGTHSIPNLTLLSTQPATLQKEIIESIKRLLHTGYEKIDLILPHYQVFSFTDFAAELSRKYGMRVEVIDSKTYGLALRRMVEECSRSFINQKPTQDISSLVQKITKNTHYWLMPKTNLGIRKTIWYNNILSSMSKFELHQIPMIRFEEEGCTTKNKNIFADNIEEALKDIKNLIASTGQIPREVLIEQTGTTMDIANLQAKLQRILPANRIQIVSADPQVATELGDYIGICLR